MPHNGSQDLIEPSGNLLLALAIAGIVAAICFAFLYLHLRWKTRRQKRIEASTKTSPAFSENAGDGQNFGDPEGFHDIESEKEEMNRIVAMIIKEEIYLQAGISPKTAGEFTGKPTNFFGADFERIRGERFCDFINRLRMEKAGRLLSDYPQYTVEAVGKMCGIESRQHFHRLFSEHFNTTPSAWRRKGKQPAS